MTDTKMEKLCGIVLLAFTAVCSGSGLGKLQSKFYWNTLDFAFACDEDRQEAIAKKTFIPECNIPTGIAVSDHWVVVSIPRRSVQGIPATLAYFDRYCTEESPKLIPYPSFNDNTVCSECENIISVNRGMRFDNCNRLWVFDYGKVGMGKNSQQICPPRIHVFDIKTNKKLRMYTLKNTDYTSASIFTSASVDVGKTCEDHFFYVTDQSGIIVYSWKDNDSWRFEHPFFGVDPIATYYNINGDNLQWDDSGVFATAVSPVLKDGTRNVYFHSLSSYREFVVSNTILHDKTKVNDNYLCFEQVGSREELGRSTTEVFDKQGVLFFNLIDKHAVACWKAGQPYKVRDQITIIAQDDEQLIFPSASVVDGKESRLWILSNKSPVVTSRRLNCNEINFRILNAPVEDLKAGTPCDLV